MQHYIKRWGEGIGERITLDEGKEVVFVGDSRKKKEGSRELKQRLEYVENKLSNTERENSTLKNKHQETLRQLEEATKAQEKKQASKLADIKSDYSKLEDEHKATLCRLDKVENEKKKYLAKYRQASERCNSLSTEYKDLSRKHNDLSRKHNDLSGTNKSQEGEIRRLQVIIDKMKVELATRLGQIDKFATDIARQNQRVNTSAIRDDDHFGREFANLAKDIRNWSFTHFFKHANATLPEMSEGLGEAIREIAKGANLLDIFKNRATSRRVVAGLVANKLKKHLFVPPLLGLLPMPFYEFEKMIEKTGVQKSPWLSQAISVIVKDEEFERQFGERVCNLSKDLSEMLRGLAARESNESSASKRDQKLQNIVERAAKLARDLSQQPYWFYFHRFPTGEPFDPNYMEDVGTEASMEEDDLGPCHSDCKVSLSVFPLVCRLEHVEDGGRPVTSIINRAWVTVETEESETVVEQEGGDMASEEAKGGVEPQGEHSSEPSEDGGGKGPRGEWEFPTLRNGGSWGA
ncbi:hypothetical protein L873DRAFT_1753934 [Choiromyces venosus 120613-1]|uniref:Uncharacterized protein n=1 Tax=Choiromyces venosus 120613-1 TaxID=1336337 RepID=A0A3N4J993_9PEZI|nr:hypothetical protein L873DRAFT_1753934 [Choiromyces venosus 120613-1]